MLKHLLNIALMMMLTLSIAGCKDNDNILPEPGDGGARLVNFTISIYAGDPDRNTAAPLSRTGALPGDDYFEEPTFKYERMRTLRVVLVRPDGEIEHNVRLFNTIPDAGLGQYSNIRLKVEGGENKTVYLFANEQSILTSDGTPYNFDELTPGSIFPADYFANFTLSTPVGSPLIDNTGEECSFVPMSEVFETYVDAPVDEKDYEQKASYFITRAAVKFSFHISSKATPNLPYRLDSVTIDRLAAAEYLLPRDAEYVPAKYPPTFDDRYIKQYTTPQTQTAPYTFKISNCIFDPTYKPGTVYSCYPELYFPETSISGDYNATLHFHDAHPELPDYDVTVPLPNLPALPRNTHVKINISLEHTDVQCVVDILPYTKVELTPEFGFDELLPRPPVDTGEMPPWIVIPGDIQR